MNVDMTMDRAELDRLIVEAANRLEYLETAKDLYLEGARRVVQDAAWLAARAAEVWPLAAAAEDRLARVGGRQAPEGAAVRSALRTALALKAEGATVRAARQLWRALDAARA